MPYGWDVDRFPVLSAPAPQMPLLHKAVIVPRKQITFDLTHRIQGHADDDHQAGATEELGDQGLDANPFAQQHREDGQRRQEDRAAKVILVIERSRKSAKPLPGRIPNAPPFFASHPILIGLNWLATQKNENTRIIRP